MTMLVTSVVPCTIPCDGFDGDRGVLDQPQRAFGDGAARILAGGQQLAGVDLAALLIDQDEIGECAADVDADPDAFFHGKIPRPSARQDG